MKKHSCQAESIDPAIAAHQILFGYVGHLHDARTLLATFREAALSNASSDTFAARWPSLMDSLIRVLPNEEQFEDSLREAARFCGSKSSAHGLLLRFSSRIENVKAVAKVFGDAALAAASSNAAPRVDWAALMAALIDLLPGDEALEEVIHQAIDSLKTGDDVSLTPPEATPASQRRRQITKRETAEVGGA